MFDMGKNSTALQDSIESIDEQIKHHFAEINFLRRRRNSLVPISRLPPEILAKILLINVLEDFSWIPSSSPSSSWRDVTAVCSQWREVAVNCPQFWSYWYCGRSAGWLSTFVSRSKAVPIHLRFSHTYKDIRIDSSYKKIFSDQYVQGRIREILVIGGRMVLESVFDAFKHCTITDNVEHQSLLQDSHIRTLSIINIGDGQPPKLPMQFISNKFSHLQRLELIECEFDWDHSLFKSSSITTLEIEIPTMRSCPSMTQIISILASQPNLQSLTLRSYAIPISARMATPVVANLRHLNYILFSPPAGVLKGSIGIIRALSFPRNSAAIHLKPSFGSEVGLQEYNSLIVPFISDYFSPSEPPKIHDSMYIYYSLSIRIECRPHFNPSNSTFLPKSIIEFPALLRYQAMRTLLAVLPLANLRTLSIGRICISPEEWRSGVFTYMDNLEELELEDLESRTAVVALIPGQIDDQQHEGCDSGIVASTDSTSVADIQLPNLKRLLIRGAYLQEPVLQGISLLVALLRCIERRSKAGHPLDSVTLRRPSSEQLQDVKTLRKWTKLNYWP